jgi:hypothetical protein
MPSVVPQLGPTGLTVSKARVGDPAGEARSPKTLLPAPRVAA